VKSHGFGLAHKTQAGFAQADHGFDPLWTLNGEATRSQNLVVLEGGKFFIGRANVHRQWVRNVQKTPPIKLSITDERFEGRARFLTDRSEHERGMAGIRRKYWMDVPIIVLGRVLTTLGVLRDNTGSFEVTLAQ